MKLSKTKESIYKPDSDFSKDLDLVYTWDSSIPEKYKKNDNKRLRRISSQPQKIGSVDYLKFSNKVLQEYSKNATLPDKRYKTRESFRKDALSKTFINSDDQLYCGPMIRLKIFNYRYPDSTHYFNMNPKKINEMRSFAFELPEKGKEKFLVHKYSIPNGLTKVGSYHNYHKVAMSTGILNPNLKDERKGLVGGKITEVMKNRRRIILARIAKKIERS